MLQAVSKKGGSKREGQAREKVALGSGLIVCFVCVCAAKKVPHPAVKTLVKLPGVCAYRI